MVFSADDGLDVGRHTDAPHGNAFTGAIKGVQLAIGEDAKAADHLVDPQHAVAVAMARQ
jgi:hypothetical protein